MPTAHGQPQKDSHPVARAAASATDEADRPESSRAEASRGAAGLRADWQERPRLLDTPKAEPAKARDRKGALAQRFRLMADGKRLQPAGELARPTRDGQRRLRAGRRLMGLEGPGESRNLSPSRRDR